MGIPGPLSQLVTESLCTSQQSLLLRRTARTVITSRISRSVGMGASATPVRNRGKHVAL